MSAEKVKALISALSMSQGFYGRLQYSIESSEDPEGIYTEIGEGCKDDLDVIFKLEC